MIEPIAEVSVTSADDGSRLIRVSGEVDMANADTVGHEIRAAADPATAVTLDLGPVEFFDSSALHMLQQLSAAFDRAGGRLTVAVAPTGIVGRLLTITRMDEYLHVRDPLDSSH